MEASEKEKVNALLDRYIQKIEDTVNDYEELKIRLKRSAHAKTFLHEVHGELIIKGKRLVSKETQYNLYKALSMMFHGLLTEIEQTVLMWKQHKIRTPQKIRRTKAKM